MKEKIQVENQGFLRVQLLLHNIQSQSIERYKELQRRQVSFVKVSPEAADPYLRSKKERGMHVKILS